MAIMKLNLGKHVITISEVSGGYFTLGTRELFYDGTLINNKKSNSGDYYHCFKIKEDGKDVLYEVEIKWNPDGFNWKLKPRKHVTVTKNGKEIFSEFSYN